MRLLTLASSYPNRQQPNAGVFVENRLRHLLEQAAPEALEARVVAPVPWFPLRAAVFGRYGEFARVPRSEERFGIPILHPRHPVIPKVGTRLAAPLLARALEPVLRGLRASGYDFDAIDAHFFYPDGVAAARLGRALGVPVVITARGSDIHYYPQLPGLRAPMLEAADRADALIAVSQALKDRMVELGMEAGKIRVLRNGVDLERFAPSATARDFDPARPRLLAVGRLIPLKGHDRMLRALAELPGAELRIAGEGPLRRSLEALARELGVADRVDFAGSVPHAEMPELYRAADVLLHASEREGCPNVLLEAMACGTPVAASAVGGVPELVGVPAAGVLFRERTPEAIARAIRSLLERMPARRETRAHAEGFGWQATSEGQLAIFRELVQRGRREQERA